MPSYDGFSGGRRVVFGRAEELAEPPPPTAAPGTGPGGEPDAGDLPGRLAAQIRRVRHQTRTVSSTVPGVTEPTSIGPHDAPPHAGQVVRRILLRRNIVIDAETAQLVDAAVQAALRAGAPSRPPRPGRRVPAADCEPLF